MKKTKDTICKIIDVRNRRLTDHANSELSYRLFKLESAFEKRIGLELELLKYFPVSIVTCIEGYFRLAIKNLIDAGEPYLSNARKLASGSDSEKKINLEFDAVKALHSKQISIGELIAYTVPLSNFDQIKKYMDDILNKDFVKELSSVTNRWEHEINGKPKAPILAEPDSVIKQVRRTFEIRHIVCHELASNNEIKQEEIEQGFLACILFLKASAELIQETLYPNAPLTQEDMNIEANSDLKATLAKVVELNKKIQDKLPRAHVEAFNRADDLWNKFMDAWAKYEAKTDEGGTLWPVIYCGSAKLIAEYRIQQLTEEYDSVKHL